MTTWMAVLLVAAGSYLLRFAPFLLGERLRPGEGTQSVLRHAGMGGITALLVTSVAGFRVSGQSMPGGGAGTVAAVTVGVLGGMALALRGRSMTVVVTLGGSAYALVTLGLWIFA